MTRWIGGILARGGRNRRVRAILTLALLSTAAPLHPAQAQVGLPRVQLPRLPVDPPVDVNRTLEGVTDRLDPGNLVDLRRLQIRALIRDNRRLIEPDPRGEPILRSEITAFSPSEAALERARDAGFSVVREKNLEGLGEKIVVLQAPRGMSTRRALRQLRRLDPEGTYDYNHIYSTSGVAVQMPVAVRTSAAVGGGPLLASSDRHPAEAATSRDLHHSVPKIGLIDGGVDTSHVVFRDVSIHQYGCSGAPVPSSHGTAVASLIAGRSVRFHGALPGAMLYAADVYCGSPSGGAVDAVADAFAWLVREGVPTINVSLVGPPNVTLQSVVRVVIAKGHVVVAAVGNDGPSAPPLYPASYPDVIGVTGVDARQRALVEAARGKQVDFAAPGADMAAANIAQSYAAVRGTSFAAPIVAGLLAAGMLTPNKAAADRAIAQLTRQAIDLGSRGPDSTYGNGLVGGSLRMEPALARFREE